MKIKFILTLLLALVVAGSVTLFFSLFESYEEIEDLGWRSAAQRNPYLAAQHYLQRQGVNVKSYTSFDSIDTSAERGTLFIDDSSSVLSTRRVNQLKQWIEAGGHLIVAAHHPGDDDDEDRLLSAFRVGIYETDCGCQKYLHTELEELFDLENDNDDEKFSERLRRYARELEEANTAKADSDDETDVQNVAERMAQVDPAQISELQFTDIEGVFQMHFDPRWALSHPALEMDEDDTYEGQQPFYWSGTEYGVQFLQMEAGEGLLSVMVDKTLWDSNTIDYFDHAYLLHTLVDKTEPFHILYGSNMPSIFRLLWRHGKEILIAMGVLLCAWLVYRSRRFGPIVSQHITVRRSIGEHIRAAATFLWRRQSSSKLLQPLRDDINRRARVKVRGFAAMNERERIQSLAKLTSMAELTLTEALNSKDIHREDSFISTVQCLQNIKALL